MSVKRYGPAYLRDCDGDWFTTGNKEKPDGELVRYSDYAAIEEERDKLAREVMRLVNINEQLHERHNALRDAVEDARFAETQLSECWTSERERALQSCRAEVDRLLGEEK